MMSLNVWVHRVHEIGGKARVACTVQMEGDRILAALKSGEGWQSLYSGAEVGQYSLGR